MNFCVSAFSTASWAGVSWAFSISHNCSWVKCSSGLSSDASRSARRIASLFCAFQASDGIVPPAAVAVIQLAPPPRPLDQLLILSCVERLRGPAVLGGDDHLHDEVGAGVVLCDTAPDL